MKTYRESQLIVRDDFDGKRILDAFPDAVVVADADRRIVYANPAATSLLGWPPDELRGRALTTFLPPRLHDAAATGDNRFLSNSMKSLLGRSVRMPAIRRDGTEIDVDLSLTPLGEDGEAPLLVVSLRDASEREAMERQLATAGYLRAAAAAAARLEALPPAGELMRIVVETLADGFDAALA
ncbi:MAG: PAS domain S-box protein, partial [Myxococcota bacterium]